MNPMEHSDLWMEQMSTYIIYLLFYKITYHFDYSVVLIHRLSRPTPILSFSQTNLLVIPIIQHLFT